jgi:hypothetical protein
LEFKFGRFVKSVKVWDLKGIGVGIKDGESERSIEELLFFLISMSQKMIAYTERELVGNNEGVCLSENNSVCV